MAENTKIQWADHTFNPWRGCTKVAPGCANCYADAQSRRNPKTLGIWGPNGTRVVASEAMWREPVKWNKHAGAAHKGRKASISGRGEGEVQADEPVVVRPRVFCASLADVFEDWAGTVVNAKGREMRLCECGRWTAGSDRCDADCDESRPLTLDDVRARLFRLIDATPNLDWLLLTKRPENFRRMIPWRDNGASESSSSFCAWQRRENVWLGVSIACQEDADRNVPHLLKCSDLCAKTFLSIEPLVGPVDLWPWFAEDHPCSPDWVIVGGESGPHARPCDIEHVRSIVRQCQAASTKVFVKQVGSHVIGSKLDFPSHPRWRCSSGDAARAGPMLRDRKGGDPEEWPEDVRVREVPA